jgi:hypothetical protein
MEMAEEQCCIESENWKYEKDGVRLILSVANGPTIIVELSTHVTNCKLCSPCCPNGGDLDSPTTDNTGVPTYCLPPDLERSTAYVMYTVLIDKPADGHP